MIEAHTGYGSKAIIPVDDEHFYLVRRTKNLLWTFFGGQSRVIKKATGEVEVESPIKTLRRELYEEGKLSLVVPPEPKIVDIQVFTPEEDHEYQRIIRETRLACAEGEPELNYDEHCDLVVVNVDDALRGFNMDGSTRQTLQTRRNLIAARLGDFVLR